MYIVLITTRSNTLRSFSFSRFDDALAFAEYKLACYAPHHIQIDEVEGKKQRCLMWAITASDNTTELVIIDNEPALRLRGSSDILYRSALYEVRKEGFLYKVTGELLDSEYVKKTLDEIHNGLRRWYGPEGTEIIIRENWITLN